MAYFPMFIDIEKKKCLQCVVEDCGIAPSPGLLDFRAQITVVCIITD